MFLEMRVVVFVGVFILLYQETLGKPLSRKAKSQSTELIREKRDEVDEDEKSSEMQKFMLDLSAKEDMSRLRERFKSGAAQDVENDKDYRRLKRFSIHDADGDVAESSVTSGIEAMNKRSLHTSRDDEKRIASFEKSSSPTEEATSIRSEDRLQNYGDQSEYSDDNMQSPRDSSAKREEDIYSEEKLEDKSKRSEDKSTAKFELRTDNLDDGNEHDKNLHDVDLFRNIADNQMESSRINSHHTVGGSWELIHNYPTAFRPSLSSENTTISNNTTMHSESLGDDLVDGVTQYDADDVAQYERAEKSRRKPRVSLPRPTRSVETDYEVREISKIDNPMQQGSREDDDHVVMVNTRAIKRDGYIGCFIDQHPNRDLTKLFTVNNLTPDSCRSVCKEKGHVYAGVQYGYLCHCGDEYGKYGEAGEHECNSACLGDEEKKCGGFWRNSVYTSEVPDNDEAHDGNQEDSSNERETRSQIDRVIPLPESEQEEAPVRQDITVYLRTEIPKTHDNISPVKHTSSKEIKQDERQTGPAPTSKRTEIPTPNAKHVTSPSKLVKQSSNVMQRKKKTDVNNNAYLHPQTGPTVFVPSNIVLRTLKSSPEKKKYTGFIKLKQNWDDGLRKKTNPKTLILAGNIESAFAEMFAKDPQFVKAEVLSLREAEILDNPDTVHKVLVEFALIFEKEGLEKDETLRKMVENSSRLGEMPVFVDSLDIKEYKNEENDLNKEEATAKKKRQDGVDEFLEEVFRQI